MDGEASVCEGNDSGSAARVAGQVRCASSTPLETRVLAIACDDPVNDGYPEGSLWTLAHLTETTWARVAGPAMSRSSTQRTRTMTDLRPHKSRMWLRRMCTATSMTCPGFACGDGIAFRR